MPSRSPAFLILALTVSLGLVFGLWMLFGTLVDRGVVYGFAAASITILGVILLHFLPRRRWLVAGLLLPVVIFVSISAFWYSYPAWGISDWDYYFSLHHTIRNTVLTYHTLPLWNPYTCGGTAALADPEFSLFTPSFLLELIFGVERGIRLAIFLVTITGGLGMLLLGKRIGLSVYAALLAAIVYALGSVNLLEIVEGHPNVFAAGWIPWIFWAWLGAYRQILSRNALLAGPAAPAPPADRFAAAAGARWGTPVASPARAFIKKRTHHSLLVTGYQLLGGFFLALTFYQGGIYLLMYTALAFIVLPWLTRHPLRAYRTTLYAGLWAVGLTALKLVPVMLWLRQFQDAAYASSAFTLPYLHHIFFGRYLHGAEVIPNQGGGWHEYGAYIGITAGMLVMVSLLSIRTSRLVRALVIAAVITILISSTGPMLQPFFDHASFLPRSNISRIVLFAVLPLALLAGSGLDFLRVRLPRVSFGLTVLLLGISAAEVMTLAYALSEQAFVLPPVVPAVASAPPPIAYTAHDYKTRYAGDDYTRAYAATLAGYGTLTYCSPLQPPMSVRTIHDEENNEIMALSSRQASYVLQSWSPNIVTVAVSTPEVTEVILNTNYARGWFANDTAAKEITGRVGTVVPAGAHTVVFQYRAPGKSIGVSVTVLTFLIALRMLVTSLVRTTRLD